MNVRIINSVANFIIKSMTSKVKLIAASRRSCKLVYGGYGQTVGLNNLLLFYNIYPLQRFSEDLRITFFAGLVS